MRRHSQVGGNKPVSAERAPLEDLATFLLTTNPAGAFTPGTVLQKPRSYHRSRAARNTMDAEATTTDDSTFIMGTLPPPSCVPGSAAKRGTKVGEEAMDRQIFKMKIDLLLHEAWKLDESGRGSVDTNTVEVREKLHQIRDEVTELIQETYGHKDENLNKSELTEEDYVELASDYFDVQAEDARKMFKKIDTDQSGTLDLDELRGALNPFFDSNSAMQQLRYNALKAKDAEQVKLFTSPSLINENDVVNMEYLVPDLGIFIKGNILLMFITGGLFVNSIFSLVAPETLGLGLYFVQSLIYIVYCIVYWRYFRADWWSTTGLWLYTVGYLLFTDYFWKVFRDIHLTINAPHGFPLAKEKGIIIAFVLWSIGSVPFFLARIAESAKDKKTVRYKYDHVNPAARGGVLFFAGSVLFLVSIRSGTKLIDAAMEQSAAYALYIWGRVECVFGILFNARDTSESLKAAVTWRTLTTGLKIRAPNLKERLVHLFMGKRSDDLVEKSE